MPTPHYATERLDAVYAQAARRPRTLIAAGAGLGLALAFGVTAGKTSVPALVTARATAGSVASARPMQEHEPLAVVGAYNAASIAAAASGDAAPVLAFFADDSGEPDAIRVEFARRADNHERHRSTLVRWGVAEQAVRGNSALIETQEVWDDQVFRDGERVDSRRGTTMRIRYRLSRTGASAPWRIQAIDSSTVIP